MRKESEKNQGSAQRIACTVHVSFNVDILIACSKLPSYNFEYTREDPMHVHFKK